MKVNLLRSSAVALAACWMLSSASVHAQALIETSAVTIVAQTNDLVPGLGAGETFSGSSPFGTPVPSANGKILFRAQFSGGTIGACDGAYTQDWLDFVATHPAALGVPFVGGETVNAQCWYRDPAAPKTTNLSNALEFVVQP